MLLVLVTARSLVVGHELVACGRERVGEKKKNGRGQWLFGLCCFWLRRLGVGLSLSLVRVFVLSLSLSLSRSLALFLSLSLLQADLLVKHNECAGQSNYPLFFI